MASKDCAKRFSHAMHTLLTRQKNQEAEKMKLENAETLAKKLIQEYGLDYSFKFDWAKRRCGLCNCNTKTIQLSRRYVLNNDYWNIRDTILHEIAHALTPGEGHNKTWKAKAASIGCTAKRCRENITISEPKHHWICLQCGAAYHQHRKSKKVMACKKCCDKYCDGAYNPKYCFTYYTHQEYEEMKLIESILTTKK